MYQGTDFYEISGLLSEEERMIQKTVRDFVQDEYIPKVAEYHRKGIFPKSK